MMKKVYILTEGGDGIGLGHIMRCGVLFEEIKSRNHQVEMIVFGENIDDILSKYNAKNIDWKEKTYLDSILTKENYIIIDSYIASLEIYQYINQKVKKCLYIDDYSRINYPKGDVLNPSLYAETIIYPKNNKINYLLGKEYIILRKEFRKIKKRIFKTAPKKILITLGGTDIRNLTPKLIRWLNEINNTFEITVIVGNFFHNLDELKKIELENVKFKYSLNAAEMKEEMETSDFIISACGQTIHEILAIGVPFFSLVIIENQEEAGKYLKSKQLQKYVNYYWLDDKILRERLRISLKEYKKVKDNYINKNGVEKIIEHFLY